METNQNNQNPYRHTHNGVDSEQIDGSAIKNAPQSALTAADSGSLSSADSAVIANLRTRLNEMETRLRNLGLLL